MASVATTERWPKHRLRQLDRTKWEGGEVGFTPAVMAGWLALLSLHG